MMNRALPELSNCLVVQGDLNAITSEGLPDSPPTCVTFRTTDRYGPYHYHCLLYSISQCLKSYIIKA